MGGVGGVGGVEMGRMGVENVGGLKVEVGGVKRGGDG